MEINKDDKKIKLDHEEIPGFMQPMKMFFKVEDAKILEGIAVGDSVQGRLKVNADKTYFITELKKN